MSVMPYSPYPQPGFLQIGDIQVRDGMVLTPVGACPLRGSRWTMIDHTRIDRRTPTWAVVMSIVGFFCLTVLSLLFLLAKEQVVSGFVEVVVSNDEHRFTYRTVVPAVNQMVVPMVHDQMRQAEAMANYA
ncbi:MAG: hypothetical protein FWE61_04040 [Micrococcales bacterium]|nr:hypothetical protein [Micrococcales bacterium]